MYIEKGSIRDVELVKPIESTYIRKFSRHQCLFLYSNTKSFEQKCSNVFEKIKNAGIKDFVAFQMSSSKDIMYPYGLVVIFQSYNESYYMHLIHSRYPDLIEELDKYKQDNEYEVYLDYLEQNIISESINDTPRDSFEISYPEKLYSAIQEGWEINKIYRFGFFEKDIRADEWLINEAVGLKGENGLIFEDICETKFNEKYNEMNTKLLNYLRFNNELVQLSEMIASDIHMLKENLRIRVWYYNPNDIIWSLAHMAEYNTIDGLPMFNVYLDCVERDVQYNYHGYLKYSFGDFVNSQQKFIGDALLLFKRYSNTV
ncbi:MAG: hypothetical protein FIA99_03370 [Ruminiclostridium sp.]|nr:hypothetical protein [Ruminiclostridium sp.]